MTSISQEKLGFKEIEMPTMTKSEIIDVMISEGYDYGSACRLVFGDTANYDEPNCETAFDEFYGAHNGYISEWDRDCYSDDSEPDILARADESAAYNENRGEDDE